jgi:hypothetical protein
MPRPSDGTATRSDQDYAWLDELAESAPDVVAGYRSIESRTLPVVGANSTGRIVRQLDAIADALGATVRSLPDRVLRAPGDEADWNVAQTVGHTIDARRQFVLAAALVASGRWPKDAAPIATGVPGPPDASRGEILRRLDRSRNFIRKAAARVVGREETPCPLEHPYLWRLTCGEWVLFAGVHDLMHLDQLHRIERASTGPRSGS